MGLSYPGGRGSKHCRGVSGPGRQTRTGYPDRDDAPSRQQKDQPDVADQHDDLLIRFPARSGYLSISRLNATAVGANGGFDVDELDDLRLAVDEAVSWLLLGVVDGDDPAGDVVELSISCRDGSLTFRGHRSGSGLQADDPGELVHAILSATVDEYATGMDDEGRRYIALVKQTTHHG
jgi:hypothetical protein